jgi:hypothetical protein
VSESRLQVLYKLKNILQKNFLGLYFWDGL